MQCYSQGGRILYRHTIAMGMTFHSMKKDAIPLVYTGPRSVGAQAAL